MLGTFIIDVSVLVRIKPLFYWKKKTVLNLTVFFVPNIPNELILMIIFRLIGTSEVIHEINRD